MALFSVRDLTTPASRDDVQAAIYRVLALLGVNTTSWAAGAVVRTIIVSVSSVLAAFSQLQTKIAASGFLDLSEGDWLTLVAYYVYGVTRIEATFASGTVTLANSGGGVYTLDPDDLVVSNPTTGKAYRNVSGFTLGALATLDVPISAVESGAASTSAAHTITVLTTTLLNVTSDNALVVVGLDGESDAALRLRCREKLGSLSPMGPWDAYAYAARNAKRSTGEPCGVTRTRTLKDGFGNVTTVVASASGPVVGTIGDTATDLGAVDEAIQTQAEPLAVTAITQSANPVAQDIAYELWMYNTSGAQVSEIQALISAALIVFFRSQPIGGNLLNPSDPTGKIYTDAIRRAIADVSPLIFHVLLTTPGADLVLNNDDVGTMGTITGQLVHQVPPAEGRPVMTTHTFRDRLRQISVPWLATGNAEKYLYAIGLQIDSFAEALVAGIKIRFPNVYSGESLPLIGRERRIARGSQESDATYAPRLTRWLDDHRRRGGPYAMLAQLHAYLAPDLFTCDLIYRSGRQYHMDEDGTVTRSDVTFNPDPFPEMWARWWLIVTTDAFPAPPMSADELADVALIPTEWNAAHCFGTMIILRSDGGELWDYPVTNVWDESGVWDTPNTIDVIAIP